MAERIFTIIGQQTGSFSDRKGSWLNYFKYVVKAYFKTFSFVNQLQGRDKKYQLEEIVFRLGDSDT